MLNLKILLLLILKYFSGIFFFFSECIWLENWEKTVAKMMMFLCAKHLYIILHKLPGKHEARSSCYSYSPPHCSKTSPGFADQLIFTTAQER